MPEGDARVRFGSLWPKDKLAAGMGLFSLLIGGDNLTRIHDRGDLWFQRFLGPACLLAAGIWLYRAYRPKQPERGKLVKHKPVEKEEES